MSLFTVALAGVFCILASPADADVLAQAEKFFTLVESDVKPGASRALVLQKLKTLSPAADADYRLRYAHALALVHERQYTEALRELTAVVKEQPAYLPAQRLRAWLLLVQKKYTEALPALETISRLIPPQEAEAPEEDTYLQAAQFLGTAFGFLNGPGEALVKEPVRAQYETRIVARLEGKRRDAFDAQVAAVAEFYDDIKEHGEEAFLRALDRQSRSLAELHESQSQLAAARSQAATKEAASAKQLRDEWDKLQKRWNALRGRYNELASQALPLQTQRAQTASQIYLLENPKPDSNGKIPSSARDDYNKFAPLLTQAITRLDAQLLQLDLSMRDLAQQGLALESRMTQITLAGQEIGETFALQEMSFREEAKKLAAREARAKRKTPKGPSVNERSRLYITYDDFPYELEKQQLLDSLPGGDTRSS